jgi:hypothetical protein
MFETFVQLTKLCLDQIAEIWVERWNDVFSYKKIVIKATNY